jgi:hypothetical protein
VQLAEAIPVAGTGIKLPLNFNSPLKARSISDFWRRWHMTMTRFFTITSIRRRQ